MQRKRKKEKDLIGGRMRWGADALVCGRGLDVDNCEDKEKERKTYWMDADGSGCGWWKRVQ